MQIRQKDIERILAHADRDESTGCLISRYSVGSHGYAQAWDGQTVVLAHRLVWVHANGPIPEGMTVDHTCKSKRCVEVGHMRMLTNFDNARRTSGRDWPLGQCVNGHPDSELRTEPSGRKRCRICAREYQRRYNRKRRPVR